MSSIFAWSLHAQVSQIICLLLLCHYLFFNKRKGDFEPIRKHWWRVIFVRDQIASTGHTWYLNLLWLVKNGWPAVRRRLHMHACMAGLSIVGGAHVNRPAVGSSMRPCRCRAGSTSDQAPGPHDVRPAARLSSSQAGMHAMHRRPSSTRPHRSRKARTNAWRATPTTATTTT